MDENKDKELNTQEQDLPAAAARQEKKAGYRYVLSQTQFLKYVVANVLSRVGDCIDGIVYMWTVYEMTGSASWSALIFVCNILPNVLIQPFSGTLIEHKNKRSVVTLTHFLRAGIVLIMAAFYISGKSSPWLFLIMTFATTIVETFNIPASTAIVPKLVDMEYYEHAVAFDQSAKNTAQLVGTGIAGAAVAILGSKGAFFLDAGMFFIAGLLLMTVRLKDNAEASAAKNSRRPGEFMKELREGFAYVTGRSGILKIIILFVFTNACTTPLNALQTPMVVEIFGQGAGYLSVMGIAISAGSILGSTVYPKISEKLDINGMLRYMGSAFAFVVFAIPLGRFMIGHKLLCGIYGAAVLAALGFTSSIVIMSAGINIVKSVEEQYLSRSLSIYHSATAFSSPVTALVISAVATKFSTFSIFMALGAAMLLIYIYVLLRKPDFTA